MEQPVIPHDEASRLESLRRLNILDTPPEFRFDRLTSMAQRIFNVSTVLVSLVDEDRQWFKSAAGFDVTETARDISFCGHAILHDGVFIVPDALQDSRFADNPIVIDAPWLRFYAGCPLKSPDGKKLGTLCLIDYQPREFTDREVEILQDLAAIVEDELRVVQMATVDDLTQLSNRRGFMMLAQHSLNLCQRQEVPASLVYFDLDHFKPINDQYGHAEGDRALNLFADQMRATFRVTDLFARLSGDEFAVLLINAPRGLAEEVVSKFRDALQQVQQENNCEYELEFSHGVVEFNEQHHKTIDALLDAADKLMYLRKKRHHEADRVKRS